MLRPFRSIYPTVDPLAFIDSSAQIIGDVHIGARSSVWMNVVVRGDVNAYADDYVRYRLDFRAEHTPA